MTTRAYSQLYLNKASRAVGNMLHNAVLEFGVDGDDFEPSENLTVVFDDVVDISGTDEVSNILEIKFDAPFAYDSSTILAPFSTLTPNDFNFFITFFSSITLPPKYLLYTYTFYYRIKFL